MKSKILIIFFILTSVMGWTQNTSTLKGVVMDFEASQPVIGAGVWIEIDSSNIIGTISDFDGKFTLNNVPSGKYHLNVSFIGKISHVINNITVKDSLTTLIDTVFLIDSQIIIYTGCPGTNYFFTYNPIPHKYSDKKLNQTKEIVLPTTVKIEQEENLSTFDVPNNISFKGQINASPLILIDGVKVMRNTRTNLPRSAVKEYTYFTNGLPAKYGDTESGALLIDTKSFFDIYEEKMKFNY